MNIGQFGHPRGGVTPACRVYATSNQTITNNVSTPLNFDTVRFDTDGIFQKTTFPTRLTCRTPGIYMIFGSIRFAANATGYRNLQVNWNGDPTAAGFPSQRIAFQQQINVGGADAANLSIATGWQLASGDYLELVVNQTSGGNLDVTATTFWSPEFGMVKIG